MKIQSLGRQTDLIFAYFSGSVVDKGDHLLIQTPDNPGYYWGNYIIFNRPPQLGDLQIWKDLFDQEFPYYKEPQHYAFAWDTPEAGPGEPEEFLRAGFELETSVVLSAKEVVAPKRHNPKVEVRKITSGPDWEAVLENQMRCADPKYLHANYETFKRKQMSDYQRMAQAGWGDWFGAFMGDTLLGDLGIFYNGQVGRFQNVETHPAYYRQGICSSLIFEASQSAFCDYQVETLVMVADPQYHAARIYESVGFQRVDTTYSLFQATGGVT